jgi:hypothetical protein
MDAARERVLARRADAVVRLVDVAGIGGGHVIGGVERIHDVAGDGDGFGIDMLKVSVSGGVGIDGGHGRQSLCSSAAS